LAVSYSNFQWVEPILPGSQKTLGCREIDCQDLFAEATGLFLKIQEVEYGIPYGQTADS
jgi:hypothetical protein